MAGVSETFNATYHYQNPQAKLDLDKDHGGADPPQATVVWAIVSNVAPDVVVHLGVAFAGCRFDTDGVLVLENCVFLDDGGSGSIVLVHGEVQNPPAPHCPIYPSGQGDCPLSKLARIDSWTRRHRQ